MISSTPKKRWWNLKKAEVHGEIKNVLSALEGDVSERNARWRRYLSLYLNKDVEGWAPGTGVDETQGWRNALLGEKRLYVNPISNCCHTLAARIASQKIAPQFLTSTNGVDSFGLRETAKKAQKAVQGEWQRENVYRKVVSVFFDAAVLGLGAMAVFSRDGRVCFERTFPGELIIDAKACQTTEPRTLYQVRPVPADVLVDRYPKFRDEIWRAVGNFGIASPEPGYIEVTDLVEMVEAWHLPSGKVSVPDGDKKINSKGGRHAVTIPGATLEMEDWTRDHFPFAWLRWSTPVIGWYPQGIPESSEPLQSEANKLLRRVQDAHHIYSVARTFVPRGAVKKPDLRNVTGDIVEYDGNIAPKTDMPPSVSSEVYQFIGRLVEWVYEGEGVSMLSATSKKPAGVESGVALRTLQDTESGRHSLLSVAFEDLHVDLAKLTVEECQTLAAAGEQGYESRYRTKSGYEAINWGDLDLDRDAYELQVFPTSYLPYTPTGRLATVQEMLEAGFIDRKQAVLLLSFPDLDQFVSLETAALEDIDRQIEAMLVDGKPEHPERFQDLEAALARVTSALIRARCESVGEDRQQLLLDYIDQAVLLLEPPAPPPEPGMGDQPGAGMPPEMMPPGPMPMDGAMGEMPVPIPDPQAEVELATPEEMLE